jgi:hypothetical protein
MRVSPFKGIHTEPYGSEYGGWTFVFHPYGRADRDVAANVFLQRKVVTVQNTRSLMTFLRSRSALLS